MKDFSQHEWGLVLAGGGGKGAYQVGAFKALWENNIQDYITAVSGTSVGALNAILFAYGDEAAAEDAWRRITPKQFLDINPDMIDFQEGMVPREGLLEILDTYIDLEQIRTNEKSIYVTVTEFDENGSGEGTAQYFKLNYMPAEKIKDALLASSALPVIYAPVLIDGKLYRDGGLKDNLPIEPLYREGIRHFIVIGLSPEPACNTENWLRYLSAIYSINILPYPFPWHSGNTAIFFISKTPSPSSVTTHSPLIPLSSSTYIIPLSR